MDKPHTGPGVGSQRKTRDSITPRAALCPYASECRSITPSTDSDGAFCNHCGQFLSRTALLELFFGVRP